MRIIQKYTIKKNNVNCVTTITPYGIDGVQTIDEEQEMLSDLSVYINIPSEISNYVKLENGTPVLGTEDDGELITVKCKSRKVLINNNLNIVYSYNIVRDNLPIDEIFTSKTLMAEACLVVISNKIKELLIEGIAEMRKQYNVFSKTVVYDNI